MSRARPEPSVFGRADDAGVRRHQVDQRLHREPRRAELVVAVDERRQQVGDFGVRIGDRRPGTAGSRVARNDALDSAHERFRRGLDDREVDDVSRAGVDGLGRREAAVGVTRHERRTRVAPDEFADRCCARRVASGGEQTVEVGVVEGGRSVGGGRRRHGPPRALLPEQP
ncbi:hypothetical protein [Halobaculum sp. D14]|uniref:hypothetical protein n=1 Tax=unclassified Halobaculum TaxID=2640896 RepID=UPI003EB702DC